MSIYALKSRFQNMLRPAVTGLYRRGITANQVTLFACLLSVVLGGVLTLFADLPWLFYLLPLWLFLRMALNAADGMLAREFQQQSRLGGYLNEISDVLADAALYLPFAFIAPFSAWQIAFFIWLATMTEFCGVLGEVHGNGRRYEGPLGKSDRAFLFGVLALIYALFGALPNLFYGLLWVVIAGLIYTCYRRVQTGLSKPL